MDCPTESKPLPPGTMGWPIIGETFKFLKTGLVYYAEKFQQYGHIFKTKVLGEPTVVVIGPDNLATCIGREEIVNTRPMASVQLIGANSIIAAVGSQHPPLKKCLEQAFTPDRLSEYLPCVQRHIRSHMVKWMERDQDVLGFPSCVDVMTDILFELVIGLRPQDDHYGQVKKALVDFRDNILGLPIKFPGFKYYKACQARATLGDFIESRMSTGHKDSVSMMDFLLSRHGQDGGMDEEKVKDNVICFLLSGTRTTASAMTSLLFLLGTNPDVLEKVREELCSTGLSGKDLDLDLLQTLEYVQSVEKESLRCFPPVSQCYRKAVDDVYLDNYHIPKDWRLFYSIGYTHVLASKQMADGDLFRPSRWLEKDCNGDELSSSSYHYIPFGLGSRLCLGHRLARLVMHVFIVELALTARWDILNPDSPSVYLPVIKPSDDLPMKFHKL